MPTAKQVADAMNGLAGAIRALDSLVLGGWIAGVLILVALVVIVIATLRGLKRLAVLQDEATKAAKSASDEHKAVVNSLKVLNEQQQSAHGQQLKHMIDVAELVSSPNLKATIELEREEFERVAAKLGELKKKQGQVEAENERLRKEAARLTKEMNDVAAEAERAVKEGRSAEATSALGRFTTLSSNFDDLLDGYNENAASGGRVVGQYIDLASERPSVFVLPLVDESKPIRGQVRRLFVKEQEDKPDGDK
ncbi:MAG: hypothetical protein KC503_20980 [Myxococcales bacterium]|nr:hypothetical protein [Myxococcales bacterium]